jgi:DNA replication protein DnaC
MRETLVQYCKQLKFSRNIVENAATIQADNHMEFLEELFKLELENRETKRKSLYLKQARFDVMKTFNGYIFDEIQIPSTITVAQIMGVEFVDKIENLILYGPSGRGKTHMAVAAGVAACQRSKKVRFFRATSLVNELVDAKKNGNLRTLLKGFEKIDLLICDELGYIPLDYDGAKLLYQVLADCYERKSLIITTNLEFNKWNNIFYDEKLTAAILDRLIHHSHLLIFDSVKRSYRLEHSLMNERKTV